MAQKINIPQQNQPFRRQASLGGNVSFRDLGNEEDNNFITLAKVTKVYYKQGRIDFKLSNTNIVTQEVAGNHSVGSAPIPVDFFGHKPDGTVFGHYRPIKIGDVVAIAYLNGHKSSPIVIGVYPDNAQAYEAISPTMYADGDDNDSGVANDVLSEQKIHPSMQIEYRSGSGAIAKALNGHSFLAIDDEVSHDYNQLWQNYNTVGFFSQNGKIVNPLKEKAGDWTLIHEDNPDATNADRHRTRFFVSKRGELQIVFMDNTSEGDVLVMEGAQHKGFTMTQYYDTPKRKAGDMSDDVYNPDLAASPQYVRFNLGGEGKEASIEASSLQASILQSTQLAVRTDGVYLNGKLLVSGDREFSSESLIEQAIENSPYLKGTFKGFNDSVEKVTQGIKDVADDLDSVEETFDQRVNDLKKLNQDNQDLINQVSKDSQDAINQSNKDNKSLIDQATQEAKDYTDQGIKGANQYTDAGIKNANAYTDSGVQGAKDYTDSTSRGDREYTDGKFSDADKSIKELQKEQDAKIYNLSQDLHNSVDGIPTQISSTKEWVTQYVDQSNQNLIKTTNESIEDASLKTNQQVDKKIADIGDTVRQAVDTANSVSQAAQKAGENATKSANIVQNNINDMRDNMATYLRDSKDNQGSGDKNSDGTFKNKSNMWGKILDGVYLDGNTYATHMTADVLEAGTLNGNNMTFKNVLFDEGLGNHISANIIDTGTLNAVTIKAGSITADKINSPELAVITKRLGDIEAGSISIGKMKKGDGNTKNQSFDPTVTKTFDVKKVFNTVTQEQDPINVTEIPSNFWEDVAGRTVALTVDVDIENYLAHPISVSGDGPLCGVRFALSQGSKVSNHDFQVNTRGLLDKTNTTMQLVGSIDVPSDCTGGTTLVYGNIRAGKITIGGFTFEYNDPSQDNADPAFNVDHTGHVTANSIDVGPGGTITGGKIISTDITGASVTGGTVTGTNINGVNIDGSHIKGGDITGTDVIGGTFSSKSYGATGISAVDFNKDFTTKTSMPDFYITNSGNLLSSKVIRSNLQSTVGSFYDPFQVQRISIVSTSKGGSSYYYYNLGFYTSQKSTYNDGIDLIYELEDLYNGGSGAANTTEYLRGTNKFTFVLNKIPNGKQNIGITDTLSGGKQISLISDSFLSGLLDISYGGKIYTANACGEWYHMFGELGEKQYVSIPMYMLQANASYEIGLIVKEGGEPMSAELQLISAGTKQSQGIYQYFSNVDISPAGSISVTSATYDDGFSIGASSQQDSIMNAQLSKTVINSGSIDISSIDTENNNAAYPSLRHYTYIGANRLDFGADSVNPHQQVISFGGDNEISRNGIYFDYYGNIWPNISSYAWKIHDTQGNTITQWPTTGATWNNPVHHYGYEFFETAGESPMAFSWISSSDAFNGARLPMVGRADWNNPAGSGGLAIANGSFAFFRNDRHHSSFWGV